MHVSTPFSCFFATSPHSQWIRKCKILGSFPSFSDDGTEVLLLLLLLRLRLLLLLLLLTGGGGGGGGCSGVGTVAASAAAAAFTGSAFTSGTFQ